MPPLPIETFVLGGWDLGTHADLIFQGILFAQFTNYWSQYYKSDSLSMKLFVLGLCLATTFKSAHAIAFVWIQNVEYFMDIGKASQMLFTSWVTQSTTLIAGIIGFSVQAFFCRRLWIISNNIYVVAFVMLLFVFGLISGITAFIFSGQLFQDSASPIVGHFHDPTDKIIWGPIHYGTVVAGDVILSGTTIYFLLKRSRKAQAQTVGILNRLTVIIIQSAAPVTLCTLANFISGELYAQHPSSTTGPTALFIELTNMMLPKLYAMSAMWTLNARKELSSRFSTDFNSSSAKRSRSQIATMQFRRHSVDGSWTVKIESSVEMMDIPEHMFEPRTEPYPGDINRPKSACRIP
ncbi:hypothetical protein C8J57DRAFT_1504485 [Mycena rebaudengoi]|nr:hypothetical protein C8J57DRAFT_1504485 [Mycena rebaudengoi]